LSAASISKGRIRLTIFGTVQGVGFRPFVYNLAQELQLCGSVKNDGRGVIVEIEGESALLESFKAKLFASLPPLANVVDLREEQIALQNDTTFTIEASEESKSSTMLLADISLCDDCRKEMQNPKDRRYNYPFINCTNCGPRYTIINALPYDRKNTSMKDFIMCDACAKEYNDPTSRRYHAQPISCFECGPKLNFKDLLERETSDSDDPITQTLTRLQEGSILAIKGLGGFHIVCDATNSAAVEQLRKRKHRPTKPLAVMFRSLYEIKKVAKLTKEEEALITSKERPIVLVKKRQDSTLSNAIAPNIDKIGVFLPYTPLHEILLKRFKKPIVATSANLSGEPIIRDESELIEKLPLLIDALLTHNREIINACDDSVVMSVDHKRVFLRLARGFGPNSFYLKEGVGKNILAVGANQKNTISLAFGNTLVHSAHIGDLGSLEAFEYFTRTLDTFQRVYAFQPDLIVCDKHPNYETRMWAKEYVANNSGVELIELQHHYAHALSVMAEYELDEEVLAFCFDGTGYGDDGSLWGGEVLLASAQEYKRAYHFQNIYLLGGDKAVREPRRVAISLLFNLFTYDEIVAMKNPLVESFSKSELKTLHTMFERKINAPQSSSVGRLFDGVYALSGHLRDLGYEGESGLIMEKLASGVKTKEHYTYSLKDQEISYDAMIQEILQEESAELVSAKFINTLLAIIVEIAQKHPKLPLLLSGGVFQNRLLLSKVTKALKKMGRRYYVQEQSALNDGSISLGQIYYGIKKYKGKK